MSSSTARAEGPAPAPGSADPKPIAWIYARYGVERMEGNTADDGTVANAKRLAERAGYEVRILGPDRVITAAELAEAAVWIQPGAEGDDLYPYLRTKPRRVTFQKSNASIADLKDSGMDVLLKDAVQNGLGYFGICAGVFVSQMKNNAEALNLLPGVRLDGHGAHEVIDADVCRGGCTDESSPTRMKIVHVGGPTMKVQSGTQVEILATTRDLSFFRQKQNLIVKGRFGAGTVVLSGAHPEASTLWEVEGTLTDAQQAEAEDLFIHLLRDASRKTVRAAPPLPAAATTVP